MDNARWMNKIRIMRSEQDDEQAADEQDEQDSPDSDEQDDEPDSCR